MTVPVLWLSFIAVKRMNVQQVQALCDLAETAGRATLEVRKQGFRVTDKADRSPVTEADLRAHRILVDGIARLTPDIPIISEEGELASLQTRQEWPRWYLVDPLDGTREYASGGSDFTVNIALIEAGRSVLGIVHVPVSGETYVGDVDGGHAHVHTPEGGKRRLRAGAIGKPLRVVASKSHRTSELEAYIERIEAKFGRIDALAFGSSLKFCALAADQADIYPRLGPTSQWDTAAGQAVLEAAGGVVWAPDGSRLSYEPRETFLNSSFLACADASKLASDYCWAE